MKITGTLKAFAGGSLTIRFISHGGGKSDVRTNGTTLDADGKFALDGWDNTSERFRPSETRFTFFRGGPPDRSYTFNHVVSGEECDLTPLLANFK